MFNPALGFDYNARKYGAIVFRFIVDEFLIYDLKVEKIYKRLIKRYQLNISPDTVSRIFDDILKLKSFKIDEKKVEIIRVQGYILLSFDG